MTSIH